MLLLGFAKMTMKGLDFSGVSPFYFIPKRVLCKKTLFLRVFENAKSGAFSATPHAHSGAAQITVPRGAAGGLSVHLLCGGRRGVTVEYRGAPSVP